MEKPSSILLLRIRVFDFKAVHTLEVPFPWAQHVLDAEVAQRLF